MFIEVITRDHSIITEPHGMIKMSLSRSPQETLDMAMAELKEAYEKYGENGIPEVLILKEVTSFKVDNKQCISIYGIDESYCMIDEDEDDEKERIIGILTSVCSHIEYTGKQSDAHGKK